MDTDAFALCRGRPQCAAQVPDGAGDVYHGQRLCGIRFLRVVGAHAKLGILVGRLGFPTTNVRCSHIVLSLFFTLHERQE